MFCSVKQKEEIAGSDTESVFSFQVKDMERDCAKC